MQGTGERVVVVAEHTPNPDCVKLCPGRVLLERGRAEFADAPSATGASPLAAALFALGGIRRVLIGQDFVSVTKVAEVPWKELAGRLVALLKDHLEAGAPVLAPGWMPPEEPAPEGELARIREVVEGELRQLVARDGGDVSLLGIRDGVVELRLGGACVDCPRSRDTLRQQIERRLRAVAPEIIRVVARQP